MEKIVLLGCTGSIGGSVLDVIRNYPDRFKLIGVSAFKNIKKLEKIIEEFSPSYVAIAKEENSTIKKYPHVSFFFGEDGLNRIASLPEANTVVIGITGIAGLLPTISAIKNKKRILSANKESIVVAGDIVQSLLNKTKNRIIPLDSEHNAIFNIINRLDKRFIRKIYLTASGGPFLKKEINEKITTEDVLNHPTWNMGNYITVNSATMMNKGFEVIEAHYLFNMNYEDINVLVHPQSLVHGMVETIDGSFLMAASPSDMRYPIALSLFYPEIPPSRFPALDLTKNNLEFQKPDLKKFPLLKLAYETGKAGGILPAVLNAANEVAVEAFLKKLINFIKLPKIIIKTLNEFDKEQTISNPSIEDIFETDKKAREKALQIIKFS